MVWGRISASGVWKQNAGNMNTVKVLCTIFTENGTKGRQHPKNSEAWRASPEEITRKPNRVQAVLKNNTA